MVREAGGHRPHRFRRPRHADHGWQGHHHRNDIRQDRNCECRSHRRAGSTPDQLRQSDRPHLHEARLQRRRDVMERRVVRTASGCHCSVSIPKDDYEFLVKESRGRRVFSVCPRKVRSCSPSPSVKARTGAESGWIETRTNTDSSHAGIRQGMPYGNESDPKVVRIDCLPTRSCHGSRIRSADHRHGDVFRWHYRRCHPHGPLRKRTIRKWRK